MDVVTHPHRPSMTELLTLEPIDTDLYRGTNEFPDSEQPTLYGGQIAAQALMAAGLSVPDGRFPHSLHGYFLRPGQRAKPVVFKVERDRDGRSFSARRVSAVQDGLVIFDLTASFQVSEPGGEYAVPMPADLPPPEDCPPDTFSFEIPNAEARVVPPTWTADDGREMSGTLWLRIRERLADNRLLHACAVAYLSDIGTGFHRADVVGLPRGGTSIDHAMWFRTPIRADEWILHHMWPLHAGGGRGLYGGSMFSVGGTLGVTITQEGLLRPLRKR